MSGVVVAALVVVGAYALGGFPTAALVGRRSGFDPQGAGSGNPGASNSFRLGGARAGVLVLVGDVGKGAIAAALGLAVGGRGLGVAAGAAAVVGHVAPIARRFRGGKGVATAVGMIAVLEPVAAIAAAIVWAAVARVTRTAVVASVAMVLVVVVSIAVAGRPAWEVATLAGVAVLVVLRHRGNLARLRRGEESTLTREETSDP
ncbi:MAG: acyl phosphate:glycerol-3-phosphate acyltransferase [Acidimicrobiaceae bacterium]